MDSPRPLQHNTGHKNAQTLLGVAHLPWDTQVRTRLDPIAPRSRDPVGVEVCERLAQHRMLAHLRVLGDHLLVALEGTNACASKAMPCSTCLTRPLSHGQTLSSHAALTPVIVCPGQSQGMALPPEDLMPHEGHATQAGERAAGTRWLGAHAAQVAPPGVTVLGAALSSHQPWCALVLQHWCPCILTCQPDSHRTCYERGAFWQAHDALAVCAAHHWHGRFTDGTRVRDLNEVLLGRGDDAVSVHGCESTGVKATTGAQRSPKSWITNQRCTAENVVAVAQAGRGRWKIANANTHVRKPKGDHLEHNCGHGKPYLAACMLSLTLRALLFQTVLAWSDAQYALLRRVLARRQTFFQDVQAFMRSMVFDSWDHLMDFMIRGLKIESQIDTS